MSFSLTSRFTAVSDWVKSAANNAGQTVTATVGQATEKVTDAAKSVGSNIGTMVRSVVESNPLLGDFTKEQSEFIKEHGGNIEANGVPPWVGCEDEEAMKEQILSLSQDKRNFVRNPPIQFDFDLQSSLPVALAILKHDDQLSKMRFEIVPRLVNEETFWRNYYYRVSLLKQSTQANNLTKGMSSDSSEAEGPDDEDMLPTPSPDQAEKNLEEELTKDLQEFEVVEGDNMNNYDEAELERDLAEL